MSSSLVVSQLQIRDYQTPARHEFRIKGPTTAIQPAPRRPSINFESFRDGSFRVAMSTTKSTTIKPMRVVRATATALCHKPKSVHLISNVSTYKEVKSATTAMRKLLLTTVFRLRFLTLRRPTASSIRDHY